MATFTGDNADNVLVGTDGDDQLFGLGGNDVIDGRFGFDLIDGGEGNDTTTYSFYSGGINANLQTGTVAFPGNGDRTDRLVNIENVIGSHGNDILIGDGFDNYLAGGDGDDLIDGSFGFDTIDGGGGNDTATYDFYFGGINASLQTGMVAFPGNGDRTDVLGSIENVIGSHGNDTITGNELDNYLAGGDGDDLLDGGFGNDRLDGGAGSDTVTYTFYSGITNNTGNGAVASPASANGINADLQTGVVSFPGIGGDTDTLINIENVIGSQVNDAITGDALSNILSGGAGNDILNGKAGTDQLLGGSGDDVYIVNDAGDLVVEKSNEGLDLIASTVSYVLPESVEQLGLLGDSNINATGNTLDNTLLGNAGVNTLDGAAGSDTLIGSGGKDVLKGGTGADKFVFTTLTDGVDRIVDFSKLDGDKIVLVAGGFNGLSAGSLRSSQFVLGRQAKDSNDRLIYNQNNGSLFYDADGRGGMAQVQIATFDNKPGLKATNFLAVSTSPAPALPIFI